MSYHSFADLGGQPQPVPVQPEPENERFHAEWERRALALTLAMGATGAWNLDMARSARETLSNYGSLSYYQIWIAGLEKMLQERGLVRPDELAAGRMLHPALPVPRTLAARDVAAVLAKGAPTARHTDTAPRFSVGQAVRTRNHKVEHHTRLPGYAMGKQGRIERVNGQHVFPDTHAHAMGEQPQWLYTVVFEAQELWGPSASGAGYSGNRVSIDAWEPYLEPVGA